MNRLFAILFLLSSISPIFCQTLNPPDHKLTQPEIANKTIHELWLLRNSIFAKHGRTFKTYELHAFFMKQAWYKPDEDFKQSDLSSTDLHNINLLSTQENKLRQKDYTGDGEDKKVNFSNVYNIFQYPEFNSLEIKKLSQNGFVVLPTLEDQLFHIYENNDYLGVPSFITTDAILQLYHLYFDMTLRTIETEHLSVRLKILIQFMTVKLEAMGIEEKNPKVLEAIHFDLAYLAVCEYFLNGGNVNPKGKLKEKAWQEIELCQAHEGWADSPLLDRKFDYSQFIPRGHYTRNDTLKNYFKAMMWLGNAGLELGKETEALGSILMTQILHEINNENKSLIGLWKDIYEPTVFYVGLSDDTGPLELKAAMDLLFPSGAGSEEYARKGVLEKLSAGLASEKISGHGSWGKQKKQFRLMGQRFVPDSYIFHRLTNNQRRMPNSLDIMAGFGNDKAYELMMNEYRSSWEGMIAYPDSMKLIMQENEAYSEAEWKQNLYYHWLYNLQALYDVKDQSKMPFFMTTDGWERKSLSTGLASWSELRHNTILYAKQSGAAECGGDGDEMKVWIPEPPKGYVEPNIEFYARMLSLMDLTMTGLEEWNMLEGKVKHVGEEFIDLVNFLKTVSEKEWQNAKLSLEEYDQIQKIGSLLDNLTLTVLTDGVWDWWMVEGPDKNMPVIADVHTADSYALEVGVGKAHAIYVIVEIEGKLKLTRGAIFSYYEFPWPSSDRLTDEKWQQMLNGMKEPDQPEWINYKSDRPLEKPLTPLYKPKPSDIPDNSTEPGWKMIYYDTGC